MNPGDVLQGRYRIARLVGQGGFIDVYALGATLYQLLTDQEPPESVLMLSGAATLLPAAQLNRGVTFGADQAIHQAMVLDANRRLQSVAAFQRALSAQAAVPISARAQRLTSAPRRREAIGSAGLPSPLH